MGGTPRNSTPPRSSKSYRGGGGLRKIIIFGLLNIWYCPPPNSKFRRGERGAARVKTKGMPFEKKSWGGGSRKRIVLNSFFKTLF